MNNKKISQFFCEKCNYCSKSKSDYTKHLSSKKHNRENNEEYSCICNKCDKKFKSNSGLWRHKIKCNISNSKDDINSAKIIELLTDIKNNQNTPTINNHHNNNINIQMYLNENFKEGPNLMDIVNKMTIESGYKNKYEKIGYDGIVCEMWKNTLDDIPLKNRPIFCIKDEDPRQEILHVRDGNIWNTVTELEWIKDIYDFENVTNENMTIINRVLNKLGENILLQLETKYGKHCDFASFKRQNHSDILYPTCLIEIINYIVKHVKIDKDILLEKVCV
jgi:uncharacterized protein (UPF0147 family)